MLLKNPTIGASISDSELPYFIKLKLDTSLITEDWIANNVPFEELEQIVILHLNENEKNQRIFKNTKHKKKSTKYLVKECYIMESDITETYRTNDGSIVLKMSCKNIIRVVRKTKNKKIGMKELYTILNFQLVIDPCKVLRSLTKISISFNPC
jgi:hypothetical protein